jgi:hypothetical protein
LPRYQCKYYQQDIRNTIMEIHQYHRLHENYVNHDLKHHYLHLPVNSSSWGKATFSIAGFDCNLHDVINNNYTTIVFLRDPIDRWLSGLATWLTASLPQYTPLNEIRNNHAVLDILFNIIRTDEHTEKQQYFLQGLNQNNMKFFMVNESLSESVVNYCASVLKKPVPLLNRINETTLPGGKLIPKNYFKLILESNPKYLNRVKEFFKNDYHFIKNTQFENNWNNKLSYYDT